MTLLVPEPRRPRGWARTDRRPCRPPMTLFVTTTPAGWEAPDADLTRVPRLHLVRTRCGPDPTALSGTGSRDECIPRRSPAFRSQPRSPPGFRDFEETHAMRPHRSTVLALPVAALAMVALLSWGPPTAEAAGSTASRPQLLTLPSYRSVVIGATVVSLAPWTSPVRPRSRLWRPRLWRPRPWRPPRSRPRLWRPPRSSPQPHPQPQPRLHPHRLRPAPSVVSGPSSASASRAATTPTTPATATTGPISSRPPRGTVWGWPACPARRRPRSRIRPRWSCRRASGWGQWPACSRRLGL